MTKNKAEKFFEDILEELEENRKSTQKALDIARAKKMVKCRWCGRRTKVSKLTYIQTRWYTPPHGCTGGDYWQDGEGQFDCPKCGKKMNKSNLRFKAFDPENRIYQWMCSSFPRCTEHVYVNAKNEVVDKPASRNRT